MTLLEAVKTILETGSNPPVHLEMFAKWQFQLLVKY
jgi:hypothetical protein